MDKLSDNLLSSFSSPHIPDSLFISFEGIEGAGKSTQIEWLKVSLEKNGYRVIILREPGGTDFGERLRSAVLESTKKIHPVSEAYLFASSRAQLLTEVILKELYTKKTVVICDRYIDSSIAYQGVAGGLGIETILKIHSLPPLNILPDMTFYIKISVEVSHQRQQIRNQQKDYFECKGDDFYHSMVRGFDLASTHFPDRIVVIDGERPPQKVRENIWQAVIDNSQLELKK